MNLVELSILNQREIEHSFAALAYQYPVHAVQMCGWLPPAIIVEERVRKFWERLLSGRVMELDEDRAAAVSTTAAVEAGISSDLSRWINDLPIQAMPASYAQEIGRRSYLTGIGASIGPLAQAVAQADDLTARAIVSKLYDAIPNSGFTLPTAVDVAQRFNAMLDGGRRSVNTFIPSLDMATGGMERRTVTVLAARPSMGKTALGWQIARNTATSGARTAFFSLEMSAESLWARAACPLANVTWRDFLAGKLNAAELAQLKEKSSELAQQFGDRLLVPDETQTTDSIWRSVANSNLDVVIIDHLRFVKDHNKNDNENKRLGRITENLHDIAKAFDVPVLLLVQLNRETDKGADKRPELMHLRDSGEIEENVDNVWMLYRDSYYQNNAFVKSSDPTELWIKKFRNGPRNIQVNLFFDAKNEWFECAAPVRGTGGRDA